MGFESFQVELRGGTHAVAEVATIIKGLPGVRPDPQPPMVPGSRCFLAEDGPHVVELEVTGPAPRVSCRFTLCHPASVDGVFFGILRWLMPRLGMQASIGGEAGQTQTFGPDRAEQLGEAASGLIAARRSEWARAFGAETLGATTAQAHERFILPKCRPSTKQPA